MEVVRSVLSLPKGSSSSITGFDIRLQTPNIILRGGPEEAAGALLMGTLNLKTATDLSIRGLTLVLEGVRRVRWHDCTGLPPNNKLYHDNDVIFTHTWNFLPTGKGTFDLSAGSHEYAFDRVLPGDLTESLEGNARVGVYYNLKATLMRPTFYSDIVVTKPIRVVRTLLPSALELSQTMAIENIWPQKVEYLIETPRKAVAFGSYTPIEVYLSPLLKGLKPAKTSVTLEEIVTVTIPERKGQKIQTKKLVERRDVVTKVYQPSQYQVARDGSDNDGRWALKEFFELPRTLQRCVQDADNSCVKIRHKLRIVVQLENPDKHLSELRACLPIYLYISPNFMVQENGAVAGSEVPTCVENQEAPPSYESRVFDAMIDEECATPALSSTASSPHTSAANLPETRPGSATDYFSLGGRGLMTPVSGAQSPRDLREVALANLSRVPSYESALRSGPPSPAAAALPTYADFARVMGGTHRIEQEDIAFPEPIRPVTVRYTTTPARFKHIANHRPAVASVTSIHAVGH